MTRRQYPPRLAEGLLRLLLFRDERYEKLGDFCEGYRYELREIGPNRASFWYWTQVLKVMPAFVKNFCYWSVIMFMNYLKITVRNLIKHRGYSLINISGLAVGISCCILIFL